MEAADTRAALPSDIPAQHARRLQAWRPHTRRQLMVRVVLCRSLPIALVVSCTLQLLPLLSGSSHLLEAFAIRMLGAFSAGALMELWILPARNARVAWSPASGDNMRQLSKMATEEPWLPAWLAARLESLDVLLEADASTLVRRLHNALHARAVHGYLMEARAPLETAIQASRAAAALSAEPAPAARRRRA